MAEAVADLVAAGENDAALAARIGRANVAVQGLLAVEVLLYDKRYLGTGAEGSAPNVSLTPSSNPTS